MGMITCINGRLQRENPTAADGDFHSEVAISIVHLLK
jgi:hypothetical protein